MERAESLEVLMPFKMIGLFAVLVFPIQAFAQNPEDLERQAISTFTNISVAQAYCDLSDDQNEMAEDVKSTLENIYSTTPLRDVQQFSHATNLYERANAGQKTQMCAGLTKVIETLAANI